MKDRVRRQLHNWHAGQEVTCERNWHNKEVPKNLMEYDIVIDSDFDKSAYIDIYIYIYAYICMYVYIGVYIYI